MNNRILVPVDLAHDQANDLIFPAAIDLARHYHAELHLLTVVPSTQLALWPNLPSGFTEQAQTLAQQQLAEISALEMPEGLVWQAQALVGPVSQTIVSQAETIGAGMIVIASHNPTRLDILLGGVADRVIRRTKCSVVVLREGASWHWSH